MRKKYTQAQKRIARKKRLARIKKWRLKNRARYLARIIANQQAVRRTVLVHYGGNPPKCACCGESVYAFLTIDHKNGDASKRKREGGGKWYYWIVKHNFPSDFQVLCFNCNCSKRNGRFCPHQKPTVWFYEI